MLTKDWNLLASPRAPVFALLPLLCPSPRRFLPEFVCLVLGVLCPVALEQSSGAPVGQSGAPEQHKSASMVR